MEHEKTFSRRKGTLSVNNERNRVLCVNNEISSDLSVSTMRATES